VDVVKSREKKRLACPWFLFLLFFCSTPVKNVGFDAIPGFGALVDFDRSAKAWGNDSDDSIGPTEGLDLGRLVELPAAVACA
jgi:hypothetical protein